MMAEFFTIKSSWWSISNDTVIVWKMEESIFLLLKLWSNTMLAKWPYLYLASWRKIKKVVRQLIWQRNQVNRPFCHFFHQVLLQCDRKDREDQLETRSLVWSLTAVVQVHYEFKSKSSPLKSKLVKWAYPEHIYTCNFFYVSYLFTNLPFFMLNSWLVRTALYTIVVFSSGEDHFASLDFRELWSAWGCYQPRDLAVILDFHSIWCSKSSNSADSNSVNSL